MSKKRRSAKSKRKGDDELNCDLLSSSLGFNVASYSKQNIQSLWAGYGYISRVHLEPESGSDVPFSTVIAKSVKPRRGETGVSHERKLKSYQVEAHFYQNLAPVFLATDEAQQGKFVVPVPYYIQADGNNALFLLSDLQPEYPSSSYGFSFEESKAPLGWLAAFHACFWGQPPPDGLWEEGSYWHFETRQDEWHSMGRTWKRLQCAAPAIDRRVQGRLKNGALPPSSTAYVNRTCVHGDAKSTNIQMSQDGSNIAFYDFQYVGGGYGSRDLVYFFCAAMDADPVENHEEELLRYYHDQLCAKIEDPSSFPFEVLMQQFELCLMDYVRFMAGWGMWGNAQWASDRTNEILSKIDGGTLLSQEEYLDAIYEMYPI